MEGRVLLQGKAVEPTMGQKVAADEKDIVLLMTTTSNQKNYKDNHSKRKGGVYSKNSTDSLAAHPEEKEEVYERRPMEFSWSQFQTAAVVLHKPVGYVSGIFETYQQPPQPQQQQQRRPDAEPLPSTTKHHEPAVQLLTPANAYIDPSNYFYSDDFEDASNNHADDYNELELSEARDIGEKQLPFRVHPSSNINTLDGFVPAGRLDLKSSGLLIFTNHFHDHNGGGGVLAKKLIGQHQNTRKNGGFIEKEYLVLVEPLSPYLKEHYEKKMDGRLLPKPNKNLSKIRKGGYRLWEAPRSGGGSGNDKDASYNSSPPLRPVEAEWLPWEYDVDNQNSINQYFSYDKDIQPNAKGRRILRLVLTQGKKHQIRRMCREILGHQVVRLLRTRIGPISLDSLPQEGTWRPLRQHEVQAIYNNGASGGSTSGSAPSRWYKVLQANNKYRIIVDEKGQPFFSSLAFFISQCFLLTCSST